jgi:hypothetical protein
MYRTELPGFQAKHAWDVNSSQLGKFAYRETIVFAVPYPQYDVRITNYNEIVN